MIRPQLKVRTKLLALVLANALGLIFIMWLGITTVEKTKIGGTVYRQLKYHQHLLKSLISLENNFSGIRSLASGMLLIEDPDRLAQIRQEIRGKIVSIEKQFQEIFLGLSLFTEDYREYIGLSLGSARLIWKNFSRTLEDEGLSESFFGDRGRVVEFILVRTQRMQGLFTEQIESGINLMELNISAQERYAQSFTLRVITFFISISILLILASVVVTLWVARNMTVPLVSLMKSTQALKRGDFSQKAEITTRDEIGSLAEVFNAMIDQRQAFEKALKESEAHFRTMVQNIPGATYRCACDADWTMYFISEQIQNISGYAAEDFIKNSKRTYASIIFSDDHKYVEETIFDALTRRESYTLEYRIVDVNEKIHWVYERGQGVFDEQGKVAYLDGAIFDISARKEADELVAKAAREWSETFDAMADGVSLHDVQFAILNVNNAVCELLGSPRDDLIGKKCFQIFHGKESAIQGCPLEKAKETGRKEYVEVFETRIDKWLGVSVSPVFNESGAIVKLIHVIRDITERKRAEEELSRAYEELKLKESQLMQTGKMAAVGQLASGVAHEINNPLAGILNYIQVIHLELAQKNSVARHDIDKSLKLIEESAQRCRRITRALLDFAHVSDQTFVPLSLNEVVRKVAVLCEHELSAEQVQFKAQLDEHLPSVMGDVQLLQQAFFDIVLNAKWAIIKKDNRNAADQIFVKTFSLPQEPRAIVTVTDTGIGIPQENLSKIFEPFFTTKTVGEGTGLGLSFVYNIVTKHKGSIELKSQVGIGTTFTLSFPAFGG
ncbi:MAG: PAS domain S-box protein [Candidatus Omnitrophica bacterium]|nr:PAS domain S-box protein [Candidatus Omnitrophota bacterium]